MAQMKRETLIRKMLQDPAAVQEFLNLSTRTQREEWFPDHEITVKTKEVTNLMTGKKVFIAANTPHSCDPSTETYWSM